MSNLKLTLEYDGTEFFGSQKQARHRTVQAELETALQKLFRKKVNVIFAGRTDSGVHAQAQVVSVRVDTKIPLGKIQLALNSYLPEDVAVVDVEKVSASFHAQFDAKWKTYEYCVWNSTARSPLARRTSLLVPYRLDFSKMRKAAQIFLGRHDFRAFEAEGGRRKTAVRTIRKFAVRKEGKLITFTVESNGFLYKMVRSLVGTLLWVGAGKLVLKDVQEILRTQNRKLIGSTVPSLGLTLKKITY